MGKRWLGEIVICLFLLPTLALSGGCGYKLGLVGTERSYQTIAIPTVENNTREPGIDTQLTNAIIREFHVRGGDLEVVPETEADVVLDVELNEYERAALQFDREDFVEESRIILHATAALIDRRTDEVIWHDDVEGQAAFFATLNLPEGERSALPDAFQDLAKEIVDRVVEQW